MMRTVVRRDAFVDQTIDVASRCTIFGTRWPRMSDLEIR